MNNTRGVMKFAAVGLAMFATGLHVVGARAEEPWPSRTVSIVVPYAAGGLADIVARQLAASLEKQFKQPFIVVNRGGATGAIGIQAAAKAAPDGYTLLVTLSSISTLPAIGEATGQPVAFSRKDFSPIARLAADPCILYVRKDSQWQTFQDLVADAKKRPDDILYSSSGVNGPTHLPTEMLAQATGTKLRHIPTAGGGPAMQLLIGKQVNFFFTVPALGMSYIKSGDLRALATSSKTRIPELPDVPTLGELGVDLEYLVWVGLFTPKNVPADVKKKLGEAVAEAVKDPNFKSRFEATGTKLAYQDTEEFQRWWDADSVRVEAIIRSINKKE